MSRISIKAVQFETLKEEVIQIFGKSFFTKKDCLLLSDEIFKKTKSTLSETTIYRLFLSINNKNIPFQNTLDILSNYVGFSSWNEFIKNKETNTEIIHGLVPDDFGLRLVKICLQNREYKSVLDYFKQLPLDGFSDFSIQFRLGEIIGQAIRDDIELRKVLLPELIKIAHGRLYFFQTFVDMDHLAGYFGTALRGYAAKNLFVDTTKQLNDKLFADSLFFWEEVLKGDLKQILRNGFSTFVQIPIQKVAIDNGIQAYPFARWHTYRLVYLFYANRLNTKDIENTIVFLEEQIKLNDLSARIILTKLIEALFTVKQYSYVVQVFSKYKPVLIHDFISNDIEYPAFVFAKLALIELNRLDEADLIIIPTIDVYSKANEQTAQKTTAKLIGIQHVKSGTT